MSIEVALSKLRSAQICHPNAVQFLIDEAITAIQQAEVTDELLHPEDFNVEVVMKPVVGFAPVSTQGVRVTHKPTGISVTCDAARSQHTNRHHAFEQLRAILALHPVQSGLTGCNCRWDGDTQVQWCELHLAHKEAIHEWAERAKEAEKQLALHPAPGVLDDVVRDAERYRWLRDRDHWPAPFASSQDPEPVRGIDLDAAIDAAMLAAKKASA